MGNQTNAHYEDDELFALLQYKVRTSNPKAIANRETQNLHNEMLKCKTYYTQCKIFVMPM